MLLYYSQTVSAIATATCDLRAVLLRCCAAAVRSHNRWTAREEECLEELKKKIASSNCLGVPRPKGEVVLITDASDVGGV